MKKTDKLVITSANVFSRFIYSLIVLNEKYFIRRTSFAIVFREKVTGPKQKSRRQSENKHNC